MFDKQYYESNNYTNYLDRQDRYIRLAKEVCEFLEKMDLLKGTVLDFGCAVGFLLKGLEKRVEECYGVDISEWALEQARARGHNVSTQVNWNLDHDVVFGLDVFEHMTEEDLDHFFQKIKTKSIVFRMPICANEGEDYVLECSRVDPTHIICWTKQQWIDYFRNHGFLNVDLNLSTIYNSEGVYSGLALRHDTGR
jgi:SAM-dependent methyltransferase